MLALRVAECSRRKLQSGLLKAGLEPRLLLPEELEAIPFRINLPV